MHATMVLRVLQCLERIPTPLLNPPPCQRRPDESSCVNTQIFPKGTFHNSSVKGKSHCKTHNKTHAKEYSSAAHLVIPDLHRIGKMPYSYAFRLTRKLPRR